MKGKSNIDVDRGQTELVAADVLRRRSSAGDSGNCRSFEERCRRSADRVVYHDGLWQSLVYYLSASRMAHQAGHYPKKHESTALVVTAIKAAAVATLLTIPPTMTPFTVAASSASDLLMTPAILEAVVRLAAAVVTLARALLAIAAPSSIAALMEIAAEGMPPTVIMPCTTVLVATGLPSIALNGGGNELFGVGLRETGLPGLS
jgi:hypothetical protein